MRRIVLIAMTLLSLPVRADELIGREVPPYPAGLENLTGTCLGDTEKGEDICAWSLGTLNHIGSGAAVGVFAGKSLGNAADGTARWLVTGYLTLPPPREGYDVQIANCRRDGIDDQTIVAVARLDPDTETSDDTAWAAQFDRSSGALTEVATTGIDCVGVAF
jgi:hypothetical protein